MFLLRARLRLFAYFVSSSTGAPLGDSIFKVFSIVCFFIERLCYIQFCLDRPSSAWFVGHCALLFCHVRHAALFPMLCARNCVFALYVSCAGFLRLGSELTNLGLKRLKIATF
jgi:hypothetical protein